MTSSHLSERRGEERLMWPKRAPALILEERDPPKEDSHSLFDIQMGDIEHSVDLTQSPINPRFIIVI